MGADLDVLRAVERAPLRTVRFADVEALAPNVWRILDGLVERGALIRLAHGIYTAPPGGRDGASWVPGLEAAGLAVAAARHGARAVALMGLGAARHWGAIPRAISATTVAVDDDSRRPVAVAGGTAYFVGRDINRLDVVVDETELGPAWVTNPAQTLFDLLMRPNQGGQPEAAVEGAENLMARVSADNLAGIIAASGRANDAVREALRRLREEP